MLQRDKVSKQYNTIQQKSHERRRPISIIVRKATTEESHKKQY
jgi:hypothetical protein